MGKFRILNNLRYSNNRLQIKFFLGIAFLVVLDLFTKTFFMQKKYLTDLPIYISYSENVGSSLGLFSGVSYYSYFLISLAIICLYFVYSARNQIVKNKYLAISIGLFTSGIIGNTVDRILFGFVRDFIALKYLFIFNLADLYITIGFIFYILYEIDLAKKIKSKKRIVEE